MNNETVFNQGYDAYIEGDYINPYLNGSEANRQWQLGYEQAIDDHMTYLDRMQRL